jgi:hypothetical protein
MTVGLERRGGQAAHQDEAPRIAANIAKLPERLGSCSYSYTGYAVPAAATPGHLGF